ncbi:uncharacterized protein G2W53_017376 [Senna tora]|uniref:Uncharacterized protein n=1 Tax=Senna tora TaxID=362788 RepID=A0A834TRR8_9FABA|nr:uncharacterized protein G2W53_017376 [Senna tora]
MAERERERNRKEGEKSELIRCGLCEREGGIKRLYGNEFSIWRICIFIAFGNRKS